MNTDRHDSRLEIHNQAVKGLFIINGGAAVALLAFLERIWGEDSGLAVYIISALCFLGIGLSLAGLANYFRYNTSLAYQNNSPKIKFWEKLSYGVQYISLVLFVAGIATVIIGAFLVLNSVENKTKDSPSGKKQILCKIKEEKKSIDNMERPYGKPVINIYMEELPPYKNNQDKTFIRIKNDGTSITGSDLEVLINFSWNPDYSYKLHFPSKGYQLDINEEYSWKIRIPENYPPSSFVQITADDRDGSKISWTRIETLNVSTEQ